MEKVALQLHSQNRSVIRGLVNKLRKGGLLPAELYGHKQANKHLAVNQIEFEKLFRKAGESTIIQLKIEDGGFHNVLVHDVQRHYLTNRPIHVDFYEVSMTERLKATVALEFMGDAAAVKALGGTLVRVLDQVEVECLPGDLPHNIEIDISKLATFEDVIKVSDLLVSDKVKMLTPLEELVAKVQPPRDVEAELAVPVVEDVSTVVVEKKTDKEAEEAVVES